MRTGVSVGQRRDRMEITLSANDVLRHFGHRLATKADACDCGFPVPDATVDRRYQVWKAHAITSLAGYDIAVLDHLLGGGWHGTVQELLDTSKELLS